MQPIIQLLARFFLAFIFLMSGLGKIMNTSGTQQYMAKYGMHLTGLFLVGAICVEIFGGLSVLMGYKTKWGALALLVFLIASTLIFHTEFSDRTQLIMFMKNLAIMGGLLLLVSHGAGKMSLDSFKRKK